MNLEPLKSKLQLQIIRNIKLIQNNDYSTTTLVKLLELVSYLIGLNDSNSEFQAEFEAYSICSIRSEFKNSLYLFCLKEILANLNLARLSSSTTTSDDLKRIKSIIIDIICTSNFTDSFNVLYELSVSSKATSQRDFYIYLFKQYLVKHLFKDLLIENILSNDSYSKNLVEDPLIQKIASLPDKLFNLYGTNLNITFTPKCYYKIISNDMIHSLKQIYDKWSNRRISLSIISSIYGKLSLLGYSEILSQCFLVNLIRLCYSDSTSKWSLIAKDLFDSISYKYLESSIINLVKVASCYKDILTLIGDLIVSNKDLQYLMTEKFFFVKIMNKANSIQNLVGYIYYTKKDYYYDVFKKLLNAWSQQTSIINTSYEQHLYLTKCILVCQSYWNESDKDILSQDLMKLLLKGVEQHLHSPIANLRTLGMVVGENLMNDLNNNQPEERVEKNELKFEYDETDEIKELKKLRKKPISESIFNQKETNEELKIDLDSLNLTDKTKKPAQETTLFDNKNLNLRITLNENDSDDEEDLIPYDTSNDIPLSKTKQPAYLRDCLEILIYSDDPDKIEVTLKSIDNLCNTYHYELQEISVELLKVLLHKSNSYNIDKFEDLRINSMVSITVHYPKDSAEYLTSQFYDAGFMMTQRTDILHVLVLSIQKLSSPNEAPIFDKRLINETVQLPGQYLIPINYSNESKDWKVLVQNRIEAKTKIKKASKPKEVKTKENKYSEEYGYFFFPLLRPYDVNRVHLNIIEQDFALLGKLITSLAIILYSSANTQVLENMIKALLDFIWALKNHTEPYVRNAIIFALTLILIVMPKSLLLASTNNYFIEMKYWLENIIVNDPNLECQRKAAECLAIFSQRMKEQFAINV